MKLNPSQSAAVSHFRGPALVLAGPGAGKTAVITSRVVSLIKDHHVDPEKILVITFTRAAAAEMEERFRALSGGQTGVTFGTFHSVFFRILKERYRYEAADILREGTRLRLLEEIVQDLYPETPCETGFLQELLSEMSLVKNNGTDLESYRSANGRVDFRMVMKRYDDTVRRNRKLDFDDMLVLTKKLLTEEPEILAHFRERFRYILVDEFQDINRLQYDIVRMLAAPENNLFIVGDDDQSIYEFRGADPHIMLSFPKEFTDAKVFRLDVNYRSAPEIVDVSGKLIRNNTARFEKKLKPARKENGMILWTRVKSDREECSDVLKVIRDTHDNGVPYDEIAILFRTNNGTTAILGAMTAAGIPFYTRDRMPNIYRHYAAKPLFGVLNFSEGRTTRKNFLNFMNTPVRYFRREDLKSEIVDLELMKKQYGADPERRFMAEKTEDLIFELGLLKRMRTPYAKINYFRKGMGYDKYLTESAEEKGLNAEEVIRVMDEIQESARDYETLNDWYDFIAAYTRKLEDETQRGNDLRKDRVAVATYHAAKGLEYDTVILPDVNERIIPHEKSLSAGSLEEERRLFYVAVTRAVKNLRLFSVEERYGKKTEVSRFVRELRLR